MDKMHFKRCIDCGETSENTSCKGHWGGYRVVLVSYDKRTELYMDEDGLVYTLDGKLSCHN